MLTITAPKHIDVTATLSQLLSEAKPSIGQYCYHYINCQPLQLMKMLQKKKFDAYTNQEMAKTIHEAFESAFSRGRYVLLHRTVVHLNTDRQCPNALIANFREKEPEHFTAALWYKDTAGHDILRAQHYCDDICRDFNAYMTRHIRNAFKKGIALAADYATKSSIRFIEFDQEKLRVSRAR